MVGITLRIFFALLAKAVFPSTVSIFIPDFICSMIYSDSGFAQNIKLINLFLSFWTNESGSKPSGRNDINICVSSSNSSMQLFIAFHAADIPALSPSKQNIILFVYFLIFLK